MNIRSPVIIKHTVNNPYLLFPILYHSPTRSIAIPGKKEGVVVGDLDPIRDDRGTVRSDAELDPSLYPTLKRP